MSRKNLRKDTVNKTKENNIVVDLTKVPERTEVKVYDMLGKLILNKKVQGNRIHYFPMMKTNQLFLVVAKSGLDGKQKVNSKPLGVIIFFYDLFAVCHTELVEVLIK